MPLDPNKFIMPVLPYGPNNQLRGFRETIILAIKLNRTVVMPPFYKHRSDPSPGEIRRGFHQNMFLSKKWIFFHLFGSLESWNSYPWRKIDEDELRKFITVASPGKIFLGAHNWLGPLTVYSNACKLRHWQSFYEDLLVMLNKGTPVSLTDSVRNSESQTWPYTLTRFAKTGWSLLKWFLAV